MEQPFVTIRPSEGVFFTSGKEKAHKKLITEIRINLLNTDQIPIIKLKGRLKLKGRFHIKVLRE